jgi:hypothetical protein
MLEYHDRWFLFGEWFAGIRAIGVGGNEGKEIFVV